jgi:hypothetical protein
MAKRCVTPFHKAAMVFAWRVMKSSVFIQAMMDRSGLQ